MSSFSVSGAGECSSDAGSETITSKKLRNIKTKKESMSNISSVSPSNSNYPVTNQNSYDQSFQDLKAIGTALQSGDLTGAQSALTGFQQSLSGNSQASASSPFGKNTQANKDYQALSSALQSGDQAGAQKAYASLQSDLKAARKGHHHHHAASTSPAATNTNANSTVANPTQVNATA